MRNSAPPTAEEVRAKLAYDPLDGSFFWKVKPRKNQEAGSFAGYFNNIGYRLIAIRGKEYLAHRLAWLIVHGEWPAAHIDHINGNPGDNRIANLRNATVSQNMANQRLRVTNTSGAKGVYWDKQSRKWHAKLGVNGKSLHLGYFERKEDAISARRAAAERYFGEFARH